MRAIEADHMYVFLEGEVQGRSDRVSDGLYFSARAEAA